MTRKQALQQAIEIVKNAEIDKEIKENITKKLELCISELPFAHWSEAAIFDACDQYIEDHGRPLRLNDFVSPQLPSHPTVKNRFGMTLKEFRDQYYPLPPKEYRTIDEIQPDVQSIIQEFAEEFKRIGARTREDYDKRRDKHHPCSASLLKTTTAESWAELMNMAGVSYQEKPKATYYGTFEFQYSKGTDFDKEDMR